MTNLPTEHSSRPTRTETITVIGALGRMFAAFRERADEAAALTQIYAGGLDDLPAWAVVQACDDFTRGRVKSRRTQAFAPTVAEIHEHAAGLVKAKMERDREERAAQMPRPPPPRFKTPEEITEERMAKLRASNRAWDINPPPGPLNGFTRPSMTQSPTPEEAA